MACQTDRSDQLRDGLSCGQPGWPGVDQNEISLQTMLVLVSAQDKTFHFQGLQVATVYCALCETQSCILGRDSLHHEPYICQLVLSFVRMKCSSSEINFCRIWEVEVNDAI